MPTETGPAFAASSPELFEFDQDMSGRLDLDPVYGLDLNLPAAAASSPVIFRDDFALDGSQYIVDFDTPHPANHHKSTNSGEGTLNDAGLEQSLSTPSTASPPESYGNSSRESSVGFNRKSSSDSSRSGLNSNDLMLGEEDTDMADWKLEDMTTGDTPAFPQMSGTMDPAVLSQNFQEAFSDKSMENDFDFESAASSPIPKCVKHGKSAEVVPRVNAAPTRNAPMSKTRPKAHNKAASQHSVTQSMGGLKTAGSREVSPYSAMMSSHVPSPNGFFNGSRSPSVGVEFGSGGIVGTGIRWPSNMDSFASNSPLPMSQTVNGQHMQAMAFQPMHPNMGVFYNPPRLWLHPTPLKSRVETQIDIKMSLYPLPPGVTKLHLPTHTISKPKLLLKPAHVRCPDTLELYTNLVCTSAMQNPENLRRAFERAAAPESAKSIKVGSPGESAPEEDEESKPLNGGDVSICSGCMLRERKRAARKKAKKVGEEEISWSQNESRRVIVFNTQEMKEWQAPTNQPPSEATKGLPVPVIPEGAFQVDASMRIACYCRHQNEKTGFQVIFTIKDFQDRVIAQEISSSIMITDDHKTHALPPALSTQTSSASDSQAYAGPGGFSTNGGTFDAPGPVGPAASFVSPQPSSDRQGMQQNFNLQFPQPNNPDASAQHSGVTSATITPRNLSRQTSPSLHTGPSSKKRKSSSSNKVPSGLAMTRLETSGAVTQGPVTSSMSTTTPAAVSPFSPSHLTFPLQDQAFGQSNGLPNIPHQYRTNPSTPSGIEQGFFPHTNNSHSLENLPMHQLYSAPVSTLPSRGTSPNGLRNGVSAYHQQAQMQQAQQAQLAQAVASGMFSFPLSIDPRGPPPTIHKLIPSEGPVAGGIEVTILGSGFYQGLEVMFGDQEATTTTFWGNRSLVCLLPPSAFGGTVPVTFKHQHSQARRTGFSPAPITTSAVFKYVDDSEEQLIRTALSVLGHKMTGKIEDVRDLARRIVGDGSSSWGMSSVGQPSNGGGNKSMTGFTAATFGVDVESTLLRCLDLIDLDDSPNKARLNLRTPSGSGHTMLHLAASLGLHRFVAALLARGANPAPLDKNGFTPMHFAALRNQPVIVRRLMLSLADPTVRSLLGYTPADMASSEEVLRAVRRIEHHTRARSGSSLRSRTSSATSLASLWDETKTDLKATTPCDFDSNDDEDRYDDGTGSAYEDDDVDVDDSFEMWRSRRSSAQLTAHHDVPHKNDPILDLPTINVVDSPAPNAAMTAFRDQVAAHIHHLQQTMHANFPNLPNLPQMPQMPRLDMMPTLPDYQSYLPVRRISNLVGNNRPDSPKEQDYKWWELWTGATSAAPPAYEEIFPQGELDSQTEVETKKASVVQAAADTVADNRCTELFDAPESSSTKTETKKPIKLGTVRIGLKNGITREQQDQLRLAHAEKVKKLSRDRNLFFIWIPLLVMIILAMLYNRVPRGWTNGSSAVKSIRSRVNERINEVRANEAGTIRVN